MMLASVVVLVACLPCSGSGSGSFVNDLVLVAALELKYSALDRDSLLVVAALSQTALQQQANARARGWVLGSHALALLLATDAQTDRRTAASR